MKSYKPFINIARCLAMLLVIIGHVSKDSLIVNTIYSFHMPLFFILSGLLYRKTGDWRKLIIKKAVTLIIPFLFFYLVTLLYFILVEIKFRGSSLNSEWFRLVPLVYGGDIKGWMSHNIALWFLPALFCTEIITNQIIILVKNRGLRLVVVIGIAVIGFFLAEKSIWNLPWGLSQAMVMILFYYIGILLQPIIDNSLNRKLVTVGLLGCIVVFIINFDFEIRNDVASGLFPYIGKFIVGAVLGTVIILLSAILIGSNRFMEFFGKGDITLTVLAMQGVVYRPLIYLCDKMIENTGGGWHSVSYYGLIDHLCHMCGLVLSVPSYSKEMACIDLVRLKTSIS